MRANRANVYPSGFEYLLADKKKPECKGKNPLMDNDHGGNQRLDFFSGPEGSGCKHKSTKGNKIECVKGVWIEVQFGR